MVDQLNSNRQASPSDATAGLRRLEALLSIGQSRTGEVVKTIPQPLPTAGQGGSSAPAPATTSQSTPPAPTQAQAQPQGQTPTGTAVSTTPAGNSSSTAPQPTANPAAGPATPTPQSNYLIQVRIEGRLFELLTQRPLDPGTRVQVSRDAAGQISLLLGSNPNTPTPNRQSANASQTSSSTTPSQAQTPSQAAAQVPARGPTQPTVPAAPRQPASPAAVRQAAGTTPNSGDRTLTSQGTPRTTVELSPTATARQPAAEAIAARNTPTSTPVANNPASNARSASNAQSIPSAPSTSNRPLPGPSNDSQRQGNDQVSRPNTATRPDTGSTLVDRVSLQLLRGQLPTGQRLQVEVLSSRPLPQTPAQNPTQAQTQPGPQATHQSSTAAASSTQPVPNRGTAPSAITNENHLLRVRSQGKTLELVSPRAVEPGTRLEVRQQADGRIFTELPNQRTRSVEQALREHLPQQQLPAPLINLLSGAQASGQLHQAKPVLLDLIQILLGRSLPNPQQTDAETVRQQVQNSGTLLENKLSRGDTQNLNQDHKALLLKLSEQLNQGGNQRELPANLSDRLSQLTQQALSRVLVNQLTSAAPQLQEGGSEANRTLALDIPVLWQGKTENLQLQIQRDQTNAVETPEGMSYRWQVRLNFEINETEHLQAELTLEGQRVSVIWSGDRQIRQLVEQQLGQLSERFERLGLDVKTLGVRDETVQPAPTVKPPRSQLIDIKT